MSDQKLCQECDKLISKSNFRKHLLSKHTQPFIRKASQKSQACLGCYEEFNTKSIRQHEVRCKQFHNLFGVPNKKRKKIMYLQPKDQEFRTFQIEPLQADCFHESLKVVFPLLATGRKVFGSSSPSFNNDSNPKTKAFQNKLDQISEVSSFKQNQMSSFHGQDNGDILGPTLVKQKTKSYCQNCDVSLPKYQMIRHCQSQQHLFRISNSFANIGMKQLFSLYEGSSKKYFSKILSPGFIICDQSLRVLASRNENKLFNIASLTKLLHLLVCFDIINQLNLSYSTIYEIPKIYSKNCESKANLVAGERMSLESIILGMVIPSGNDAASVLAIILSELLLKGKSGKKDPQFLRQHFIGRMKNKAKEIGMRQTIILDEKGLSYNKSSCLEITLLLKRIAENQTALAFLSKEVVRVDIIDKYSRTKKMCWNNTNKLVSQGYIGKTGSAFDNTHSLATIKDNRFLICCLGCPWCNSEFSECACGARYHQTCEQNILKNCICKKKIPSPKYSNKDSFDGKFLNKYLLSNSKLDLSFMPNETNIDFEMQFKNILQERGYEYVRNCRYHKEIEKQLDFKTDPFVEKISTITMQSYENYLSEDYFPPCAPKMIPGKQMGIVAAKPIPKNTLICQYAGDVLPGVYSNLNPDYSMALYEGKKLGETAFITVLKVSSIGPLINHAKLKSKANCKSIRVFEPEIINFPIVLLYSARNIKEGEELLYDYNGGFGNNHYPTENFI